MELRSSHPIFTTETIQNQHDGFGEHLEGMVSLLLTEIQEKKLSGQDIQKHVLITEMEKVIFARFGLKTDLITTELLAALLPFYSNTSHIFITEFFRGNLNLRDQNKLLKSLDQKKATVNLTTAKVTGFFSEYEHPFYINFEQMVSLELTPSEITACMLHELGHAFTACEYSDRTNRTNQVLADIAHHFASNTTGDVEYVFRELEKVTPSITKEAVDKMVHGSRTVAGATWFKVVIGIVQSQTLNDKYNDTSAEQLADAFASRFGYSKQLVLALDKLHGYTPEKSLAFLVVVQLMMAATTVILASIIFTAIASGIIFASMLASFYMGILVTLSREDYMDYTYDRLKVRYLRVRNDLVEQLKDIKLNKAKVREILNMLYTVDACIKETMVVKTLPNYIANFIFSGARKAEKAISDQQLQEALVSNDLFIQSAELRAA